MHGLLIAGEWLDAAGGRTRETCSPAGRSHGATVSGAGPEDAEAAVLAARRAFGDGPWPSTPSEEDRA